MSIFRKKNAAEEETKDKEVDIKQTLLESLNNKLKGTIYDNCVIMPKGFTVDIQVNKNELTDDGIYILQVIFIIKNDELDEPMIDPIDAQGKTLDDAVTMCVEMFYGGIWHPLDQSMKKNNPVHVPIDFLLQHYEFDMYAQSIVRVGAKDKQPVSLINFIKTEIVKYIGSKKYYWVRIYLARVNEKRLIEVRVNGTLCSELSKYYKEYLDSWEMGDNEFASEKQYAIFVNRDEDKCPFTKEQVTDIAKKTIEMFEKCDTPDDYNKIIKQVEELAGDKGLAAEIRIFIPEILAKLTLGYKEGDSLFLMKDDSSIEFKKTQLRSYYYIQQVLLEYLSKKPPQENVMKIVRCSVAFSEVMKAHQEGHEPNELYVPGTSYKLNLENYKVW